MHFLRTIVDTYEVTNLEDNYHRYIVARRYNYNVDPTLCHAYRVRAEIALMILRFLLQSVKLMNYINDDVSISPTLHAIIMYSLKAKELHMKSIYNVFYILGVSECYVFENGRGSSDKVNDTIVVSKTISGRLHIQYEIS